MKLQLLFLVLFTWLSASIVLAEEGFFEDFSQLPEAVQAWQKRLFMPVSEVTQQPQGTAFLIENDGNFAIFITAAHAIIDPEKYLNEFTLHQGADWTLLGKMPFESPTVLKPIGAGIIKSSHTDWKGAGSANDVGYIITKSHPSLPILAIQIPEAEGVNQEEKLTLRGAKHFVLGFPSLASRYRSQIATEVVKARWSFGNIFRKVKKGKKLILETDADSVQGNSGGPIVNRDGELMGVVTGGPHLKNYKPYPHYYTYAAPIETVHEVLRSVKQRNFDFLEVSCKRILQ